MADWLAQLLPAFTALGGVALAFGGTAWLELKKYEASRRDVNEARSIQAFSDLSRAMTGLARRLRTTAEQVDEGSRLDGEAVVRDVDDLVGEVREAAAMARLVGPRRTHDLIVQAEDELRPLHRLAVEVQQNSGEVRPAGPAIDSARLIEPARQLIRLRDDLVDAIRAGQGLD